MSMYNFDSKNNSVATILKRKKLSEDLYQFTYEGITIGHLDKKRGVFIDNEGKEYCSITSPQFTKYKNSKVFGSYLEKDDLNLVFSLEEDISYDFLINRYNEYVKSIMYLVKIYTDEMGKQKVFVKDINLKRIDSHFDKISNSVDQDSFYFLDEIMFDEGRREDFLDEDFYENASIIEDLCRLITDVYNCEYNSSELFTIVENLGHIKEYLTTTLDTIDLQLHAYYNQDKIPKYPSEDDMDFINSDYDPYAFSVEYLDDEEIGFGIKKQLKSEEKMDLVKLRDEIKKYLINQDEALRRVLVEIARMDFKENEKNKGILLLGDSGTGKTYLMELLAKNLGVPFLIVDTTQLTIPGYVGKDIQEYLWDLYEDCDRDIEQVEKAIIFFDEVDKKGSNRKSDVSGQGVLNILLKFLDGTTYDACRDTRKSTEIVKINTSKMKVIAGGAFNDVFSDEFKKNNIGFASRIDDEPDMSIPDADVFVQKAFMTYEFMGRFPIRIRLNPHTLESFEAILKESEDSTLIEEQRAFNKMGIKLSVTPEFIKAASSNALKLKTGVRGLMSCIEEATWVAFEDAYSSKNEIEEIILTEKTLEDPSNYQKVYKK